MPVLNRWILGSKSGKQYIVVYGDAEFIRKSENFFYNFAGQETTRPALYPTLNKVNVGEVELRKALESEGECLAYLQTSFRKRPSFVKKHVEKNMKLIVNQRDTFLSGIAL